MKFIVGILLFCFIVFFHELGHFLLAKANHIRVNEFSIGFGPKLIHFKKGETEYCLKLIPFGGSCMMEGEMEDSDDENSFNNASVWSRIAVVLAGPIFNLLLAYLLMVILFSFTGYDLPVISEVSDGYPAKEAGLIAKDEIIKIDNHRMHFFRDVSVYLSENEGEDVTVTFKRDGEIKEVVLTPKYDETQKRYFIGITNKEASYHGNFFENLEYGFFEVNFLAKNTVHGFGRLISGKESMDNMMGPVGIVDYVGDTYTEVKDQGRFVVVANIVNILVILSACIGIMNLMPFPALDGGRFLIYFVEALTGKKMPPKYEAVVNGAGFILLFGFLIFVTSHDVSKLF